MRWRRKRRERRIQRAADKVLLLQRLLAEQLHHVRRLERAEHPLLATTPASPPPEPQPPEPEDPRLPPEPEVASVLTEPVEPEEPMPPAEDQLRLLLGRQPPPT